MLTGDWNQMMLHLDPSDEMRLGVEVLRRMLKKGKLYLNGLRTPNLTLPLCVDLHQILGQGYVGMSDVCRTSDIPLLASRLRR